MLGPGGWQRKFKFSATFIENPIGLAGGLALFWTDRVSLTVAHDSSAMLDLIHTDPDVGITMHLTLAMRRGFQQSFIPVGESWEMPY